MSNSFSTPFPSSFRDVLKNSMQQCKIRIHFVERQYRKAFSLYRAMSNFSWFEYYIKARKGCYNHFKDKHADSKAHELWCRVLNLMFLEKTDCLCIQRWSPLAPSFGKNVQRAKRSESAFWSCFNIKYQTNTIPSLVRHPTFYDKLFVSDSIKNVNRLSK